MSSDRIQLITTEENKNLPILIIDKKGLVGGALAATLREQFLIVLVSQRSVEDHKNIIHIPFKKKIPVIPDNSYSHIFVFYNGEDESLEILPSLIKKANSFSGKVFLLLPLSQSNPALEKRLSHHAYHSVPIIIYGEVFDKKLQSPNIVNYFIYQARTQMRLEIPNEGIGRHYPVYLEDLLAVTIAIAFSHESKKGFYFAFPRTPFSEMTVARIFQRINPDIKLDFSKKKVKNHNYYIPVNGSYVFAKYNLEGGLRRSFYDGSQTLPVDKAREIAIKPRKDRIGVKKFILGIITVFILPLILFSVGILLGSVFLALAINGASQGKFDQAQKLSAGAGSSFIFSGNLIQSYFPADFIAPDLKRKVSEWVESGVDVSEIGDNVFTTLSAFARIYEKNSSDDAANEFVQSLPDTKNSLLLLEEMRAAGTLPSSVAHKINSNEYLLTLFENTIDTWPYILGFKGQRKYLILFQNNMELRPGGGFIGSYGLVKVNKGLFSKIEIHDVYDADGKLTTRIEPPYPLRRYGGVSNWFLRDSNFAIEGSTNAAASSDLLARSTGDKVDGVISIDTTFIVNLLEAIGSVEVRDYRETVNKDNFYILTQKHAEENFFPGSTQKKDFLRSLLNALLEKYNFDKDKNSRLIVGAIEKSIKEKHLFFVPLDSRIQKVFAVNNLTGDILDARKFSENAILDFLSVYDANIGANKGNYYLKKSIVHIATISDSGQLFGEVTLTLVNTSQEDSIFGGEYKNYLRFILPKGANIRALSIDGRQVEVQEAITNPALYASAGFVPPPGLEVERFSIKDKSGIAFFNQVPIEKTKKLTINYSTPQTVSIEEATMTYSNRVFKQPGTDEDSYLLILNYPSSFIPIEMSDGVVNLGGKIRFETILNTDKDVIIKFSSN